MIMNLFRYRARQARQVAVCTAVLGVALASTAANTKTAKRRPPAISIAQARADYQQLDVMPHKQLADRWQQCADAQGATILEKGQSDVDAMSSIASRCAPQLSDLRASLRLVLTAPRAEKVLARLQNALSEKLGTTFFSSRYDAIQAAGPRALGDWKLFPLRPDMCLASYIPPDRQSYIQLVRWDGPAKLIVKVKTGQPVAKGQGRITFGVEGLWGTISHQVDASWLPVDQGIQWEIDLDFDQYEALTETRHLTIGQGQTTYRVVFPPMGSEAWGFIQDCGNPPLEGEL